jgi:mercuric ion binding protein
LHGCCQYDRTGAPSTAKSCEAPAATAQPGTAAASGSLETATFKVLGECGMCEKTIVRAAKAAGASEASWDMETHIMVVKYPAGATSVEKIQKTIAENGYDTPSMKASDASYKGLPACCQYDRSAKLD